MVSTFEKVADRSVKHISIAQRADIFVIVPATANVIAKIAHGIADDMLTTTFLAASCKKVICPAMNTGMYENPITQKNLDLCRSYGYEIFEPASGFLACGDIGKGKLEDITIIEERVEQLLMEEQLLTGKHVLVTAGPTQEALDPVRYLTCLLYTSQPSFGFLLSFPFAACLISALRHKYELTHFYQLYPLCLCALCFIYLIGCGYMYLIFNYYMGSAKDISSIIAIGAAPFVISDSISTVSYTHLL